MTELTPYPDVREECDDFITRTQVANPGCSELELENCRRSFLAGAMAASIAASLSVRDNQARVQQFMERIKAPIDVSLNDRQCWSEACTVMLDEQATDADLDSQQMLEEFIASGDPRALRAHLVVEEGGSELLRALAIRDKVLLADALADLAYVTYGCAVTFGIPLDLVFAEVHRSNMTKEPQPDDPMIRKLSKGPSYSPPDIERVLREAGAL